jgi:hypothetical protein
MPIIMALIAWAPWPLRTDGKTAAADAAARDDVLMNCRREKPGDGIVA